MYKGDNSKIEYFFRQIIADNIKKLGISAVSIMATDLRKSGYVGKADLIDFLVKEYTAHMPSAQ
jgi:hypothetical protein